MWIKVWITIFVLGFAYGKNFDTCPGGPPDYCQQGINCFLPDCVCSGTEPDVPDVKDRPQIVYLTFDDAMTKEFDDGFYTELFLPDQTGEYNFKNPNGCPIRSTFFVTAKSNEFDVTHKYWRYGNEIAAHSITHRSSTTYWKNINITEWEAEMYGVKQMINRYANVPMDDIVGVRTPYLQSGGDEMYQMMMDKGFEYDCSAPSQLFGYQNLAYGRWPYTYDHFSDMDCQIEPCPQCSFPGIWSQPILDFEDARSGLPNGQGYPCGMTDTCLWDQDDLDTEDPDLVYDLFMKNFNRAYNGNTRAPIGLYIHSAWFVRQNSWHFEGYKKFLNDILELPDVWIVPIKDGIEYMKAGNVTNDELVAKTFAPFSCDEPTKPENCPGNVCQFNVDNDDIIGPIDYRMHICPLSCPRNFPWLHNPMGQ